jgi:SNF2 family DNA or RNA helicase
VLEPSHCRPPPLVIQGSIEERIMTLHRDKRALAEGLFSGESFGEALSLEDLAGLLRDVGGVAYV